MLQDAKQTEDRKQKLTPLFEAIQQHDAPSVERFVSSLSVEEINTCALAESYTPLMYAIAMKSSLVVKIFLSLQMVDPLKENPYAMNAMKLACKLGRTDMVAELLNRNIDPASTNRDGETGLWVAANYGHHSTVSYLLGETDTKGVPIIRDPKPVSFIDKPDRIFGRSPLGAVLCPEPSRPFSASDANIIALLIRHGAAWNVPDFGGDALTCVQYADQHPVKKKALANAIATRCQALEESLDPFLPFVLVQIVVSYRG